MNAQKNHIKVVYWGYAQDVRRSGAVGSCSVYMSKRVLKTLIPTKIVLEAGTMLSYTAYTLSEEHKLMKHMQTPKEPAHASP